MHGATQMATRRKVLALREPSGKVKRGRREADGPVHLWRRIKDHVVGLANLPEMGSVIGRMSLAGVLTDSQCAAACWTADTFARFEQVHGMPRRSCVSPIYERSYGRSPTGGGILADEKARKRATVAMARLEKVLASSREPGPRASRHILVTVCVEDGEIITSEIPILGKILSAIAVERGLRA